MELFLSVISSDTYFCCYVAQMLGFFPNRPRVQVLLCSLRPSPVMLLKEAGRVISLTFWDAYNDMLNVFSILNLTIFECLVCRLQRKTALFCFSVKHTTLQQCLTCSHKNTLQKQETHRLFFFCHTSRKDGLMLLEQEFLFYRNDNKYYITDV